MPNEAHSSKASPGRSSRRRVPGNALARFWGSDVAGDEGTPRKLCSHLSLVFLTTVHYLKVKFPGKPSALLILLSLSAINFVNSRPTDGYFAGARLL